MALQITIGGVDKTSQIDWRSVVVTQELTKSADQLVFHIKNFGTKTYVPALSDEVIFTNGAVRVFAGNVVQINTTVEGLEQIREIVVKDYSNLLDSQLVSKTYSSHSGNFVVDPSTDIFTAANHGLSDGLAVTFTSDGTLPAPLVAGTTYYARDTAQSTFKIAATVGGTAINVTTAGTGNHSYASAAITVKAIIADLLATFTDGSFTMVNVVAPMTIPNISFNYISFSECMKKMVALLQGYAWYVDYNKDIHFFLVGTVIAPFNLTDTTDNYVFSSLSLLNDTAQIANDITVQSGQVGDNNIRTEYFNGDGTRLIFPLASNFNIAPKVVVGGTQQTVGVDGIDADASFQVMWNQDSQRLRFTSGNTPTAGTNNIVVTGISRFPLVYRKQSQSSILLYGLKQKFIIDKSIQDTMTASLRATAELALYANPLTTGNFRTYTDGLSVGQYINISSVIRNFNISFKIQQVKTSVRTPTTLQYEVAIETENSIGINDVLSKLLIQDPANASQPSQNTIISRVALFSENLDIEETLHTPTKTSPPYVYDTAKWNLSTWG